jgi:hypothetical protein
MSYLDVPSLKGYLRISSTDAIDDALLAQIVTAVEAEQRARCTASTFTAQVFDAGPGTNPLDVTFTASGYGTGPFTWDAGDGTPVATTAAGVTSYPYTYTAGADYSAVLAAGAITLATLAITVPLVGPVNVTSDTVIVPEDLYLAALMRGARLYARRASPEGLVGLGEQGIARIPPYDRDIDALEAPWRAMVLA